MPVFSLMGTSPRWHSCAHTGLFPSVRSIDGEPLGPCGVGTSLMLQMLPDGQHHSPCPRSSLPRSHSLLIRKRGLSRPGRAAPTQALQGRQEAGRGTPPALPSLHGRLSWDLPPTSARTVPSPHSGPLAATPSGASGSLFSDGDKGWTPGPHKP